MKKNLYYKTVYGRRNALKAMLLNFFFSISSAPRLLLEVFTRKSFGERYFSFSTAVILIVFLAFIPFGSLNFFPSYNYGGYGYSNDHPFWPTIGKNILWYLYLAAFFYKCLLHRKEIKREPSVFDFARFSLSGGIIHPFIRNMRIGGKQVDIRKIETFYEPAIFFIIGFVLAFMKQGLGYLIMTCSIIYSLSYCAAYYLADNFIMDKIDEMICNEELADSFIEDSPAEDTRGFYAYGRRPSNKDARRKVSDHFYGDDDGFAEAK